MFRNIHRVLICFFLLSLLASVSQSQDLTKEKLAGIINDMESALHNISFSYEWYTSPVLTAEEAEKEAGVPVLIPKEGLRRFNLSLARPITDSNQASKANLSCDANDPNLSPLNWKFKSEENTILITKDNHSFQQTTVQSYDGNLGSTLNIGGWPATTKAALISDKKPDIHLSLSPLGFSVFRTSLTPVTNYYLLSQILSRSPELVSLDTTVNKVKGFNTIRLDLLQQYNKQVIMRIFLSVDHNFTPVIYEYMKGSQPNIVTTTFEVQSLDKIGEKLWFPSSGTIANNDSKNIDAFQTTGAITCNQNIKDDFFKIVLPVGTNVYDKINNKKYVAQ